MFCGAFAYGARATFELMMFGYEDYQFPVMFMDVILIMNTFVHYSVEHVF